MKIFIDNEYHCHVSNDSGILEEVEVIDFDGFCQEYIEGYRFIPENREWTNEKGICFVGRMVAPWKPFNELEAAQRKYEKELAEAARILLGGN